MRTAKKEIKITGATGIIDVTITICRGIENATEKVSLDGDVFDTKKSNIIETNNIDFALPNGKKITGLFFTKAPANFPADKIALIGNVDGKDVNVGISKEASLAIESAKAEAIKEAEEDVDFQKVIEARKVDAEYYNHVAKVNNMMTLNGHTY